MIATIADASQVAEARRLACTLTRGVGFDDNAMARIALVATELATNVLKHAGAGEIVISEFADADGTGIELLSLDKGPGIADVERALEDGYSTAGSPGTGLGAIRRQASAFAVYSRPGLGTAVMARLRRKPAAGNGVNVVVGAVVDPFPGETQCGDGWSVGEAAAGPTLFVVDGSGHGPPAAIAAKAAILAFQQRNDRGCVHAMEEVHRALAPTRGAAAALAFIDRNSRAVRFVGVGNISAAVVSEGTTKRMVSHNGIVGHAAPRFREFTYPYGGDPLLVLHSDGLTAKWDFDSYPGLTASHPSLVAGILFRDHRRIRDDAAVVALRMRS
jgi:anti-sigma regulatory factor (Ser/Thr protein kinase)